MLKQSYEKDAEAPYAFRSPFVPALKGLAYEPSGKPRERG